LAHRGPQTRRGPNFGASRSPNAEPHKLRRIAVPRCGEARIWAHRGPQTRNRPNFGASRSPDAEPPKLRRIAVPRRGTAQTSAHRGPQTRNRIRICGPRAADTEPPPHSRTAIRQRGAQSAFTDRDPQFSQADAGPRRLAVRARGHLAEARARGKKKDPRPMTRALAPESGLNLVRSGCPCAATRSAEARSVRRRSSRRSATAYSRCHA